MDIFTSNKRQNRKFLIIFNPVAGNRRHALLDEVVAALNDKSRDVSVTGTTGPGNATKIAAQAVLDGVDAIVAAGGDGTINEVVSGVVGSDVPVGIIPMGTANVLALELGLSRRANLIADTLIAGELRRLHLARINDRFFFLMAGAGFDGQVVHAITSSMKRRWGKFAFAFQGLRAIATNPSQDLTVESDGQNVSAAWAIVTNVSRYGGPYTLVPDIDPGEASLTLVAFQNANPLAMCLNMVRIGLGNATKMNSVKLLKADRFVITGPGSRDIPVQVDGDAAGTLPLDIVATDSFVRVITPIRTTG